MTPFLFAVHSHQPVGNFDHIFARGVMDSYHPFLELLSRHPRIKVAIHYSGCLLEWIETRRPDHVELLRELVSSGQVEIIGGGFYEPILPIIPERDARAQIQSYFDHLERLFGRRPRGLWLAERVWDPRLPELFHQLGVEFTLVDDSHFRYGGVEPEDIWGPFLTESRGQSVTLFAIDQRLRYLIPFKEPAETIAYIQERAAAAPGFVACYGDDGEKFGMWPGTREWVFEKGWLARFLHAVADAGGEIKMIHVYDYLDAHGPRARVYLPPASYEEMMGWALPPRLGARLEDFRNELKEEGRWPDLAPLVRGGHWDMFLAKYEEANRMHKRRLLPSERLAHKSDAPPPARTALLRSQCNCAYWHGVFGGLYLNYLRHAIYEHILASETLAGIHSGLVLEKKDYDLDGAEDLIISSPHISLIISPRQGGSIVALEYPPKNFSLGNLMGRREESYHHKLARLAERRGAEAPVTIHDEMGAKEEGLEKRLFYDRFPRNSLQEHLTVRDLTLDQIEEERAPLLAALAGEPYFVRAASPALITMERETRVAGDFLRLEKSVRFTPGRAGFSAIYLLSCSGPGQLLGRFAIEFNLTLLAGDAPDRYYLVNGQKPFSPLMNGRGTHEAVAELCMADEAFGFQVRLRTGAPALVFRFPVETVSQSESGYERNYQGSCLWFTWPLELEPGEEWTVTLDLDLQALAPPSPPSKE
jgi:alpha-amylase